jgi:hypothetical protein
MRATVSAEMSVNRYEIMNNTGFWNGAEENIRAEEG